MVPCLDDDVIAWSLNGLGWICAVFFQIWIFFGGAAESDDVEVGQQAPFTLFGMAQARKRRSAAASGACVARRGESCCIRPTADGVCDAY
jgi:hypothetical protein